ncbi:ABC transporter permease [Sinomonas sp. JGH33]|uniref:ABC transporter permease n=1 Tax=Sinomonas terricola TaxID=3110330 RepID=A0ABU5T661_9MICC|nr:ABC transporter permease [Sinomonas sp. JGH33]MEA5455139.1 ABC transporter permease [Sinomonas sp. JGH33]
MMPFPFLGTAVAVETRKALASSTMRATTVSLVAGIALLSGAFVFLRSGGSGEVAAKLALLVRGQGWTGLIDAAEQVTAAGALLAFGMGLSWIVGREFAHGTISGLFALPVPRRSIALAKLFVYAGWCALTTLLLVGILVVLGIAAGFGAPDGEALSALGREGALGVLTGMLAVPCAWAATLSRGILAGLGTAAGIVVAAQVAVIAGAGPWFPIAAPALWAFQMGDVPDGALALVAVVPVMFGSLTVWAWSRLQLDH